MVQANMSGVPRRYYSFENFDAFSQPAMSNLLFLWGLLFFFIGQLIFLANVSFTLLKRILS